ncbi:hypothetical protein MOQ_001564 [Trypanosoma cruzi marinkellei]|uniref:Uncharacterized protein n=1 Tax=Trypanosoma cruzi marinkellei TaxID=85056 RepID=K2PAX1_TRYCR|nr:hypothetical protein MOQ_001564 [Trypanosoma cruzi marinkellei]
MGRDEDVATSDAILTELHRLCGDPVLRQYLRGHEGSRGRDGMTLSAPTVKGEVTAEGTLPRREDRESLVAFQARWSREEEDRLQNSIKAQRAFQQALQSLAACRGTSGAVAEVRMTTVVPTSFPAASVERAVFSFEPQDAARVEEKTSMDGIQDAALTMQEKLASRDHTIRRLQKELEETRAKYEADIASMRTAHMQSKQETGREMAKLKMQLAQLTLAGNSATNACESSGAFLEALEFKERLLQEMHDAFQHASEEWKNDTMRTLAGLRLAAEEEIRGIVSRAEQLVGNLQRALGALTTSRNNTTDSFTVGVARRLLQDEEALLLSMETKLREHVRMTVKNAVRSRVKDILRPIVERQMLSHRELHEPHHLSPLHTASSVHRARGASSPTLLTLSTSPSPMPAESRSGETPAIFQTVSSRQEQRGPSQHRELSAGSATSAAVPDELSRGVTVQDINRPSDGISRPSWLDRFCY